VIQQETNLNYLFQSDTAMWPVADLCFRNVSDWHDDFANLDCLAVWLNFFGKQLWYRVLIRF